MQALLTPLMVLLLVPYFLTIFLDLSHLPGVLRWLVMAIPFTYPFIAGPALFLGNYGIVWFGIFYQLVWFAVFVAHRRAHLLQRPHPHDEAELREAGAQPNVGTRRERWHARRPDTRGPRVSPGALNMKKTGSTQSTRPPHGRSRLYTRDLTGQTE